MISRYSVKKPFTVLVGVLLVIVLGVVSLGRMTTDLLPDMSFQYALIVTTDMGASPQEVESDVTAPLEAAMATTSNIKNVSSMSYNSYSLVTCEYEQNANMDSVVIEMQQKIDQVKAGWKDVEAKGEYGCRKDCYNSVDFTPVKTTGLKLVVQLQEGESGGVIEWKVN